MTLLRDFIMNQEESLFPDLPNGMELRFHPDEKYFPTWYTNDHGTSIEHPVFVVKGKHRYADEVKYTCVGYQFYFTVNPAIGLNGVNPKDKLMGRHFFCFQSGRPCLGYHKYDVESIFVLFDEQNQPLSVYFGAHGLGQGTWMSWNECECENGVLHVYVALNSHATYPISKTVIRGLGFANDYTSSKGRHIRLTSKDYADAKVWHKVFAEGIEIKSEIPMIGNTSISEKERIRLLTKKDSVRNRAKQQYDGPQ